MPEGFVVFSGFTDSYETTEKNGDSTAKLTVANHWSDWDAKAGTYLSYEEQIRLYPSDEGLAFAKLTDFMLGLWSDTTVADKYKTDSRYIYGDLRLFSYDRYLDSAFPVYYRDYTAVYGFQSALVTSQELPDTVKLPVVYGDAIVTGVPVFRTLTSTVDNHMWVVYALAEGECDSLVDILINDTSYTDPIFSGLLVTDFFNGTTTQTACSQLVTESALWTANHRLQGICYIAMRFLYNEEAFGSDPRPVFQLKGKKLYDPRDTTTAWSKNPALVLYDYITSSKYGKGVSSTILDAISEGADYCDTLVTDNLGGSAQSIPLFEFNGIVLTSEEVKKNVEAILFTMRGHLPWISGKYTLVIERDDDTSSFSFNEDNISATNAFSVKEGGLKSLANIMYYSIIDKDAGGQKLEIIEDSAAYLAEDGRELRKSIDNKYEDNRYRARNRASTELKRTRQLVGVEMTSSNSEAMKLQTGEVVDITRVTQAWVNKDFRIIGMEMKNAGDVGFTLVEYEPTVYDWTVNAEQTPPSNTTLPNPLDLSPPTGLVLSSGTAALLLKDDGTIVSRIKAEWTAPVNFLITGYDIYYKKTTDSDLILAGFVPGDGALEFYIENVEDGLAYDVAVRAKNRFGVESVDVTDAEIVVGKTAAPEDVTGFIAAPNGDILVFKWNQVSDLDLAGYEIRYGSNGSSTWEDGTPLTSVTRGTNVTSADVPPGTFDFFIKAVDTTGNYSANATSVTDVLVESIRDVISQVAQAPDWSGTLTNFVLHHTGKLVPQSQEANSDDGALIWGDDTVFEIFVNNPYAACTYEAPEIDIGFDDSARIWGSIDSVLGVGETGVADPSLSIDYKLAAGAYDGFESWSIGTKTLRYCKHKLTLDTSVGVAIITEFLPTVDQIERVLSDDGVAIGSGGTTITFSDEFHVAPRVIVSVVATTGIFAVISAVTSTTFHVKLFNSSGAIAGAINWEATGI